ncbi:TspO/MBR family protein [Pedobacter gandavensis]|uniref:TspO/MBR family protein n=1 Tax=Pedobacter gandavensis TaxID=2679963 RepID=UPI00292D909E|nr:TspO/MBR family protein [Pedobacter gandavensis]
MKFNPIAFVISLAIPLGAGALGSILTLSSVKTWYPSLAKPSFNPPDSLFPPVWTCIFILMGISSYLVWQKRAQIVHFPRTIAVYAIQLLLNIMWSFLFFYAKSPGAALFEIAFLLMAILVNAVMFYKIDKTAGLLFIPYFLWVCFASVLTYSIFSLNG